MDYRLFIIANEKKRSIFQKLITHPASGERHQAIYICRVYILAIPDRVSCPNSENSAFRIRRDEMCVISPYRCMIPQGFFYPTEEESTFPQNVRHPEEADPEISSLNNHRKSYQLIGPYLPWSSHAESYFSSFVWVLEGWGSQRKCSFHHA